MKVIKSTESWGIHDNKDNFEWLLFKNKRTKEKLDRLSNSHLKRIFLTSDYHHISLTSSSNDNTTYLNERDFLSLANEPSLVYLFNSNIGYIGPDAFIHKAISLDKCLIIIQDNDNHHWHEMTSICLRYSDIYIPGHPVNYEWYEKLSSYILRGRCVGTLFANIETLLSNRHLVEQPRDDGPYGPHYKYDQFISRNQIIESLNKKFSNVFLRQRHSFEPIPIHDLVREWTKFKTHWIVPVGGDIPFRFFDALCTGGIPIIPATYVYYLDSLDIPRSSYSTYSVTDLEDPSMILREALLKFDYAPPFERAMRNSLQFSFASILLRAFNDIEKFVKFHSSSIRDLSKPSL
jgi:hypothetical protein